MPTRRTVVATSVAALISGPARSADYSAALARAYGGPVDWAAVQSVAKLEAARLQAVAVGPLRRLGLKSGSVAERLRTLAVDDRWLFVDSNTGREQAISYMNDRLAALRPRLAKAFGDLPIPLAEVRRPAVEDESRGGFREPPVYFVDLRNIRARPRWTLGTVAYHETVPGHALQVANTGRSRPAIFSEAWAIYAEQLAFDQGAYEGDAAGEVGYLQWRLFRMARVIADTGVGRLGWSLSQAVETMRDLQGFDAAFVTIEEDARRIQDQPGVYAAQGLGALAIGMYRPRRRAQWPAFHRAILADGPWPSSMLAMS